VKLTSRDIVEVLKTAHELGYREFQLEFEGLQLSASTAVRASDKAAPVFAGGAAAAPAPAPATPSPPARAASPSAPSASPSREGLIAVNAPMSGTFYRSPSPGAPPFVEVGSSVQASDIICIIEVMKLFNSIRAGIAGVIADIAVDNDGGVVAGQPVIWIKPAKA
jgi:acetyl-CoA carboxylase biotin carboxyl carrier protein